MEPEGKGENQKSEQRDTLSYEFYKGQPHPTGLG